MSRAGIALLIWGSTLFAQSPSDYFDKAPPDVDDALRARITGFYQAHVDHKFREADQYVAEDTKEFYYEANKPFYMSFHIDKIVYSDNYTKAKASVTCKMHVVMAFVDQIAMVPTPSTWKLENGQWYWYVDQSAGRDTPFGHWSPKGTSTGVLPSMAGAPDIASLQKSVHADKGLVELGLKQASSGEVILSSTMQVVLDLQVPKAAGLEARLDRTDLKPGEQAKLTIHYDPPEDAKPLYAQLVVRVSPTNQVIPIRVAIK